MTEQTSTPTRLRIPHITSDGRVICDDWDVYIDHEPAEVRAARNRMRDEQWASVAAEQFCERPSTLRLRVWASRHPDGAAVASMLQAGVQAETGIVFNDDLALYASCLQGGGRANRPDLVEPYSSIVTALHEADEREPPLWQVLLEEVRQRFPDLTESVTADVHRQTSVDHLRRTMDGEGGQRERFRTLSIAAGICNDDDENWLDSVCHWLVTNTSHTMRDVGKLTPEETIVLIEAEVKRQQRVKAAGKTQAGGDVTWIKVTEAAKLLQRDIPDLTLEKAKARVSNAANRKQIRTNGKKRLDRRLDRDAFNTWRIAQRDSYEADSDAWARGQDV